jgi:hypothetical protein
VRVGCLQRNIRRNGRRFGSYHDTRLLKSQDYTIVSVVTARSIPTDAAKLRGRECERAGGAGGRGLLIVVRPAQASWRMLHKLIRTVPRLAFLALGYIIL